MLAEKEEGMVGQTNTSESIICYYHPRGVQRVSYDASTGIFTIIPSKSFSDMPAIAI